MLYQVQTGPGQGDTSGSGSLGHHTKPIQDVDINIMNAHLVYFLSCTVHAGSMVVKLRLSIVCLKVDYNKVLTLAYS